MDLGSKIVLKLISIRQVERLKGQVGANVGHQHLGDNMPKQWQRWVSVQQWESEVMKNIINHECLPSRVIDMDTQEFNMISDHSDRALDNGWGEKVIGVHRVHKDFWGRGGDIMKPSKGFWPGGLPAIHSLKPFKGKAKSLKRRKRWEEKQGVIHCFHHCDEESISMGREMGCTMEVGGDTQSIRIANWKVGGPAVTKTGGKGWFEGWQGPPLLGNAGHNKGRS